MDHRRDVQRKKEKNNRCYNVGLCAFVCLDVILLTSIIITVCYIGSEKQRDVSTEADICVPCKDITLHPDDDIEGIVRKGKNNMCCMENRKTSYVLVGYFVDHWLKDKLAKDDRHFTRYKCKDDSGSWKSKPVIKLVGRKEKQTGGHDRVLWDGRTEDAILPDNTDIVYDEQSGFVEIKKAGLYQIYTQVVLKKDEDWYNKYGRAQIYKHYVIQNGHSEASEKIILKATNSYCLFKTDHQIVTSYLGGAFRLSKGDRLAVKVQKKSEIVPIAHMNFFGAYML